jgi:hypothetical protein
MNGSSTAEESTAPDTLDRVLMPRRAVFADVPVRAVLLRTDPNGAHVESADAALVVVGSGGEGCWGAGCSGRCRAVVQRAHSAVAVVDPDGAAEIREAKGVPAGFSHDRCFFR